MSKKQKKEVSYICVKCTEKFKALVKPPCPACGSVDIIRKDNYLDTLYSRLLPKTTASSCPVGRFPQYLDQQEATALYDALKLIKWDTLYAPARFGGKSIKRKTKTFYEGDPKTAEGYRSGMTKMNVYKAATNYMNAYGDKGSQPVPFSSGPPELVDLRQRLQKETGLNLSLCYINFYWDGGAQIGWHQDREEHGSPHVLPMVTVYGSFGKVTRPLSVLEMKGNTGKNAWAATTNHGDLVIMPVGFHDNYFHRVFPTMEFARPRISLTFRNPELSPNGKWRWYGLKPQVWDGHKGKQYPPDAVYVGCKTTPQRGNWPGTPFGNGTNPMKSHHGWLKTEKEFRAYAEKKMQDPAFTAQVKALRGKHLLCSCVQDGPKRAPFCHARVSLELANPDMVEKWDDPPKGPNGEQIYFPKFMTPAETQAIYDAYMKLGPFGGAQEFLRFPDFSDVIRPRMEKQGKVRGSFKDAPLAVRKVIARISKKWKWNINYVSTIGYANEEASMFYHQHGEDHGHNTPVWILTTGAARTFGLRKKDKPKTEIRFQVERGSLLVLPNEYNMTHEHAVLKDKTARGMRIAPNMKAMDEIYYAEKKENDYRPSNAWERSKMKKGGKK